MLYRFLKVNSDASFWRKPESIAFIKLTISNIRKDDTIKFCDQILERVCYRPSVVDRLSKKFKMLVSTAEGRHHRFDAYFCLKSMF